MMVKQDSQMASFFSKVEENLDGIKHEIGGIKEQVDTLQDEVLDPN